MDIAGLAGGIAGGWVAGLIAGEMLAGPVGWVALVGTVAIGLTIGALGSWLATLSADKIWEIGHDTR